MKKNNKKGFTLAELLIVVAIIAVLVAIAIPVFTTQLEKSREATDLANIRSAYATVVTNWMDNGSAAVVSVPAQQGQTDWQNGAGFIEVMKEGSMGSVSITAKTKSDSYNVSIDTNGDVTIK